MLDWKIADWKTSLRIVLATNYPLYRVIRMSSSNSNFCQGWLTGNYMEPDYLVITWRSRIIYEKLKRQMGR